MIKRIMITLLSVVTMMLLMTTGTQAVVANTEGQTYSFLSGLSYLDEQTVPKQVYVGQTGQILPKKDGLLKDFKYAFIYGVSDENIFSITNDGQWVAKNPGQIELSITPGHEREEFQKEMERYGVISGDGPEVPAVIYYKFFNIQVLPATSPVYRLYHAGLKVHLYTTDANENSVLATRGWRQEGTAWTTSNVAGDPVYRLYHAGLKVHLYTKDANEYNVLASRGWRQEGVAYRSSGTVPVYRLYHKGIKKHLYTKDVNEKTILSTRGWRYEGVAWNVE